MDIVIKIIIKSHYLLEKRIFCKGGKNGKKKKTR